MGESKLFYLMDLERSICTDKVYFWKPNNHGYTWRIEEAGIYNEEHATRAVERDIDRRTIMVNKKTVTRLLESYRGHNM